MLRERLPVKGFILKKVNFLELFIIFAVEKLISGGISSYQLFAIFHGLACRPVIDFFLLVPK